MKKKCGWPIFPWSFSLFGVITGYLGTKIQSMLHHKEFILIYHFLTVFFCQNFYFIFSGEPSKLQSFNLPRDEFIFNWGYAQMLTRETGCSACERRNSRNSAVVVLQLDPPAIEIFIPSSHCKCQWWYTVLRHSERSASMFQHKRACGCINARCSQFMRCICVFPHMACYNLVGLHPYHVNWMHHMQTEIHQSKHR